MAFKVGDKVKLLNGGNEYPLHGFVNGEIYKVIGVTSSAFGGDKRKRITIINDSANKGYALPQDLKLVEPKLTKNQRISSLEKDMEQMHESFETLRKDYFHDIELLQERFQKKIASLEQTLANFAEFRKSDKPEIIEFEGGKYQKVERLPQEGDVVVFREGCTTGIQLKKDTPYAVVLFEGELTAEYNSRNHYGIYNELANRTIETVDVYEPIQQDVQHRTVTCGHHVPPCKTPNEQRAELIEDAKEFVKIAGADNIEFAVSEKYRAVTAIWFKGIEVVNTVVKCPPDKVFNADIFKAIALGRVQGLNVSEFENAVQPNEITRGMHVRYVNGRIAKVVDDGSILSTTVSETFISTAKSNVCGILNDTNAIYTEEAQ